MAGRRRATTPGQVTPRRARAQHPENAVQDPPVIDPWHNTRLVRQQRLHRPPLETAQIISVHARAPSRSLNHASAKLGIPFRSARPSTRQKRSKAAPGTSLRVRFGGAPPGDGSRGWPGSGPDEPFESAVGLVRSHLRVRYVGRKAFGRIAAGAAVGAASATTTPGPIAIVGTGTITGIGIDRFLNDPLPYLGVRQLRLRRLRDKDRCETNKECSPFHAPGSRLRAIRQAQVTATEGSLQKRIHGARSKARAERARGDVGVDREA